ncbi:hypothetical protein ITX31_05210 [Arthrobacter gandavensis]|uniref:hypothetical protein n=1 Tax=Arthrobacter gandavensis TaxID=169960 RepID=UPI00188F7A3A|nr:hypothetical protein [Arthrobacter gandavensis]MBF4993506.1 hypothetical protein [Arthrobacter gandavensis]
MGTSSAGIGRSGLAALAAGAVLGLAAAAAGALLERLRRIPLQPERSAPAPGPATAGSVPISARKDPNLPDWRQGMPGTPETVTVEVGSLEAGPGSPRRTWVVHNGPEWQSRPGELMVQPERAGEQHGTSL